MSTSWQQKYTGSPYPCDTGFFLPAFARVTALTCDVDCDGHLEYVVVGAARIPIEGALLAGETREFGAPLVGENGNINRRMKARARGDGTLTHRLHQAESSQIFENTRAPGPWNLTVLDPP